MSKEKRFDAAKSLYGKGHVDATRTRECVAMPGKREQSIMTPLCIVEGLTALWGAPIGMDPCHSPRQILGAKETPEDGLAVDWPRRTYCNPPYGELRKWLEHGSRFDEVVWLVPMRTHRKWFRLFFNQLSARIALDPLKFHDFDQAYPAPLLLGYNGAMQARFYDAFKDLGGVI